MSKELIVSAGRHETRVAILEDDQVVELFHEREKEYSLAGSIHKGRVTRVLPGMQSAFVDIGLDRDAFLYVSDFFEDNEEYDAVVSTVEEKVLKMERGAGNGAADVSREPAAAPTAQVEPLSIGAAAGTGVEAAAAPAGAGEQRQEGNREQRGDRGGRGRRGRRRRGGRGSSGLPDSKFFSPKTEPPVSAEIEPEMEAREAKRRQPQRRMISWCCPASRWRSIRREDRGPTANRQRGIRARVASRASGSPQLEAALSIRWRDLALVAAWVVSSRRGHRSGGPRSRSLSLKHDLVQSQSPQSDAARYRSPLRRKWTDLSA